MSNFTNAPSPLDAPGVAALRLRLEVAQRSLRRNIAETAAEMASYPSYECPRCGNDCSGECHQNGYC